MENPTFLLYSRMWYLLDLIFPPACGGCEKRGQKWCENCENLTHPFDVHGCAYCGRPLKHEHGVCKLCQAESPVFDYLRSYARYEGPLRNAILRLKYRRDIGLGCVFGEKLALLYQRLKWPVDLICPVPLSNIRKKQRGYNQAALIALPFALKVRRKYVPQSLIRVRDTASQVHLSHDERLQNVANAFKADQKSVYGKKVLVVDDVTTTGATLNACAAALKAAGARNIFCLTLARALE